jgi:DNA-binding CsgD family transcriptional regulator
MSPPNKNPSRSSDALKLRDRFRSQESSGLALDALDFLDFGIVVTNATGAIRYANRCAEDLLRHAESGLGVKEGQLVTREPNELARLTALIESAARAVGSIGGAMPILDRKNHVSHFVFVSRLPYQSAANNGARALVLINPASVHRNSETARYLRELFAFTAAEASVASHLLDGCSITQIGDLNDVAEKTIRTQVQSLLDKTQTSRQAELVSLLARALPRLRDS